ncbi:MAG: hypothetical protein IPP15_02155 [Saprospiraceae bacterium]|uniref:Uncharacterized protein n=1 Tax=Candidatus Opimibacter skivensis TaxID=2982028 RepID=A0A9D7XRE7_9BACT|nr:hypothetical protein [Candidatus Opimibacter skivensis]
MNVGLILRFLLLSTLLLTFLDTDQAQRVIVNGNGERLIMYPDGSWRLADAGDSILLRQNLQKSETLRYPSDKIEENVKRNPAEEEEYILRQWNELFFKIKDQEKKAQAQFRTATNAQFKAGELVQNAEADKKMIESDRLDLLHENYEKAIENLRTAKLRQKAILKLVDQSKKTANQSPKKIKKEFPKLNARFDNYLATYDPNHTMQDLSKTDRTNNKESSVISNPTKTSGATLKPDPSGKSDDRHASSKKTKEVKSKKKDATSGTKGIERLSSARTPSMRIPKEQMPQPYKSESASCQFLTDTIDTVTGTHRKELEPGLIFTDTDPDLRPYFKSKELITCYGKLSKMGAYTYFTIDFQIASSHSQGNFGSLESGSLLRLRLLNGKYVSLYNLKSDRGHIDPYSGNTIFSGQYALGKDEIKLLSSSPLDKIRILWGTGYEDYDVYKIDFFMDQLNCLMAKQK